MSHADSTWRDKSSWRQALMHSKRKIPDSWQTGWKAKACTSFALYLKVFKNHLYYLWHIRVLSIKPCLHTQFPEHIRSYWKVSQGWGHLITWNGPMWGIWTAFRPREGGIWTKIFQKFKCTGGCPGGLIWLVHNSALSWATIISNANKHNLSIRPFFTHRLKKETTTSPLSLSPSIVTRKEMRRQKMPGCAKSQGHLFSLAFNFASRSTELLGQKPNWRPLLATIDIECPTTEVCLVVHESSIDVKLILQFCSSTQKHERAPP